MEELAEWYLSIPRDLLDDVDYLSRALAEKISMVHQYLGLNYGGSAQTTVVIALTAGERTIIANIGDSTAYCYDSDRDQLVELTTSDSKTRGLDYEKARENPYEITAAVGARYGRLHINVIENVGQKIILSSDGVTDLISERHFKDFFIEDTSAFDIVQNAKFSPDVSGYMKSQDNISAIVIEMPGKEIHMKRGY